MHRPQTTHTVKVGQLGSFYDPPTLITGINDTVTFLFPGSLNHSVTQSTLDDPCIPLAGGFDSSIVGGHDANASAPTWTVRITNISEPIYYFCEVPHHCRSGTVGLINPPNQRAYMQFQSSAKAITPTPTPTPILTGIGAVATRRTITPSPNTTTTPNPGSIATANPTTTSPLSSASARAHKCHIGAIIFSAVGVLLGIRGF